MRVRELPSGCRTVMGSGYAFTAMAEYVAARKRNIKHSERIFSKFAREV